MANKLSKDKRKAAKNFIQLYYEWREELRSFDDIQRIRVLTNDEEVQYRMKKFYIDTIENSFSSTVNEINREKVWKQVFKSKFYNTRIEPHEEQLIKDEIERWLSSLAKTIGI